MMVENVKRKRRYRKSELGRLDWLRTWLRTWFDMSLPIANAQVTSVFRSALCIP